VNADAQQRHPGPYCERPSATISCSLTSSPGHVVGQAPIAAHAEPSPWLKREIYRGKVERAAQPRAPVPLPGGAPRHFASAGVLQMNYSPLKPIRALAQPIEFPMLTTILAHRWRAI
jgi:hypothetical protein